MSDMTLSKYQTLFPRIAATSEGQPATSRSVPRLTRHPGQGETQVPLIRGIPEANRESQHPPCTIDKQAGSRENFSPNPPDPHHTSKVHAVVGRRDNLSVTPSQLEGRFHSDLGAPVWAQHHPVSLGSPSGAPGACVLRTKNSPTKAISVTFPISPGSQSQSSEWRRSSNVPTRSLGSGRPVGCHSPDSSILRDHPSRNEARGDHFPAVPSPVPSQAWRLNSLFPTPA